MEPEASSRNTMSFDTIGRGLTAFDATRTRKYLRLGFFGSNQNPRSTFTFLLNGWPADVLSSRSLRTAAFSCSTTASSTRAIAGAGNGFAALNASSANFSAMNDLPHPGGP